MLVQLRFVILEFVLHALLPLARLDPDFRIFLCVRKFTSEERRLKDCGGSFRLPLTQHLACLSSHHFLPGGKIRCDMCILCCGKGGFQ
ncbi:hypothetical protein B0H19DRAFT_1168453 [Mycena capillaripes]|nr:hypothetical protein B0H19DRAFT_1168453 [Mycena capillaripes]